MAFLFGVSQYINSLLHSCGTKISFVCFGIVHLNVLILCTRCMCTKCLTFLHTGKACEKNIIPAQSMQPFRVFVSVVSLSFCPRDLLGVFNCHTLPFFDTSHSSASPVKDAATTARQFLYLSVMCEYERVGVRHVYTAR